MDDIDFKGSPYVGQKVLLRPFEKSDLDAIMKWWNTYETRRFLKYFIPNSRGQEEEWLRKVDEAASRREAFDFAVVEKQTNELLGGIGLEGIDWVDRSAMLGIAVHNPTKQGCGYGSDAIQCMLKFGFWHLNLHRVWLSAKAYNPRAVHVYQKVDFKEVGRSREPHFFEGKYYDTVLMDLLEQEFHPSPGNPSG